MEEKLQSSIEEKCYSAMHFLGSVARDLRDGFYFVVPSIKLEETDMSGEETTVIQSARKPILGTVEAPLKTDFSAEEPDQEIVTEIETAKMPAEESAGTESFFNGMRFDNKVDQVRAEIFVNDILTGMPVITTQAFNKLNEISGPVAMEILRKLLVSEKDPLLLIEVMNRLSRFDKDRTLEKQIFVDFLKHENPCLRQAAIRALSKYRDEETFSILSSCLNDENGGVRRLALDCLSWFFRARCAAAVLRSLHDVDDYIRKLAILICASLKLSQSISALITLLSDPEQQIEDSAAASLRKITGQNFGFKSTAKGKTKQAAIEDWRFWWRNNQVNFRI